MNGLTSIGLLLILLAVMVLALLAAPCVWFTGVWLDTKNGRVCSESGRRKGCPVVFDTVGGDVFDKCLDCVAVCPIKDALGIQVARRRWEVRHYAAAVSAGADDRHRQRRLPRGRYLRHHHAMRQT